MEQTTIFDAISKEDVLEFARGRASLFREGFPEWLAANFVIWRRFEIEANAIYNSGRRHYSARTIWHFLRHETYLREKSDCEFKLNNNISPDVARLYLMLHPERDGFFELRDGEARRAA